jgi:hypothetical protein
MKLWLFVILLTGATAQAHPVPFKGAIGVMSWNQSFLSDNWLTYSFRSDAAIALRQMRLEMPEGRSQFYGAQVDYVLHRWNRLESQSNAYVYGSYGPMTMQGQTKGAGLAGIELDSESRKFYASAAYERMWSRFGQNNYRAQTRLGLAPYEAEFDEIAAWFYLQFQYHPNLVRKQSLTPLIRLFYKSALVEAGASTVGDWMLNFMFHF